MLSRSDTPVDEAVAALAEYGVEAAFLVPTDTGLTKSILDATAPVREFLARRNIHDFETQGQGPNEKVILPVGAIGVDGVETQRISLYRPMTKQGDPRVWISGLSRYAEPWNLIALIVGPDDQLFVVNASNPEIMESRHRPGSPLKAVLEASVEGPIAAELRAKLEAIAKRGPVPSLRHGDTGVGFTLETLLGIEANVKRTPDYKGIELKSSRSAPGRTKNRDTLFSKIPEWATSALNEQEIVATYGYTDGDTGLLRLYCTIRQKANPQTLYLDAADEEYLENLSLRRNGGVHPVVRWRWRTIESVFLGKHPETFWVSATPSFHDGLEHFHYTDVVHTRAPMVANLRPLIGSGKVSVDFTIKETASGKTTNHGYLFKLHPRDRALLFPAPRPFSLLSEAALAHPHPPAAGSAGVPQPCEPARHG